MEDWISLSIYNVLIDNNVLLFLTVCVIWNWLYWFIRDVELRYKTRRSCILRNTLEITCIWNHRQWKPFALHCFFFLRKYQNSTFKCQVRIKSIVFSNRYCSFFLELSLVGYKVHVFPTHVCPPHSQQ